jgi:hypothetical protein
MQGSHWLLYTNEKKIRIEDREVIIKAGLAVNGGSVGRVKVELNLKTATKVREDG